MGLLHTPLFAPGEFAPGPLDLISDVPGVCAGHYTLAQGGLQTGVTVLLPSQDNVFLHKLPAAAAVFNGFGKSTGLMQVEELGVLETPLVLTNTLATGICWQAMARYLARQNPGLQSVNPLVLECNDSRLNDIRAFAIQEDMVLEAMAAATDCFAQGAVGAGRGMVCHGLSGGIGSASRKIVLAGQAFTLGALVLTNHARLEDLLIHGQPAGSRLKALLSAPDQADRGSVIVVLAMDAPLCARQLARVCRRALVGLSLTGSKLAHGSGEIALAFSTAASVLHEDQALTRWVQELSEGYIDAVFRAAIECVEEAVLASLWHAQAVQGALLRAESLQALWPAL